MRRGRCVGMHQGRLSYSVCLCCAHGMMERYLLTGLLDLRKPWGYIVTHGGENGKRWVKSRVN